jgi:arabinofuranosyltransferase
MKREDRAPLLLLGVLALFALYRILGRAWTCDDAFISYRYADNLAHGHGLVFNPGERVEGYTNFLFTLVLAAAASLGIELRAASNAIGIFSYFVVAAVLAYWSWRRRTRETTWVPLGAALWLVQDDLHTWATGGLETTLFAAFALGGLALSAIPERPTTKHLLGSGVLLACASLARPDGVLFALVGLASPFVLRRRPREVGAIVAPLAVIGAAYVAWKLSYYGRLLPTTFYAKAASQSRWEQGLAYVGLYFAKHWSTAVAVVALSFVSRLRIRRDGWLALAAFFVFTAWIARSAGDYMFARRLVPALPFLFVFVDAALDAIAPRTALPLAVLVAGGAAVPIAVLPEDPTARIHGIADERAFYPEALIELRKAQGEIAQEVFGRRPVRAAFGGGMCMFAYYSRLPDLVEPNGLTQYWIAEEGEDVLERIGHKGVSASRLRAHGVKLVFHHDAPPIRPSDRFDEMVVAGILRVEILAYDDALMTSLSKDPRVHFKPIDAVLKEAEQDIAEMPCPDAQATHDVLRAFYLAAHPDADARIKRAVERVCAPK